MSKIIMNSKGSSATSKNYVDSKRKHEKIYDLRDANDLILSGKDIPGLPFHLPNIVNERKIVFNKRSDSKLNVNVETWADVDRRTYMCWGDYWVKRKLNFALKTLGCNIDVLPQDAELTIYLWGSRFFQRNEWPYGFNPDSYNLMWFYSHPDNMTVNELKRYDKIACASHHFLKKMIKKYSNANINFYKKPIFASTDFKPLPDIERKIDVIFVGNARGALPCGRHAVAMLKTIDFIKNFNVKIYGAKWELERFKSSLEHEWHVEKYWEYDKLNELYSGSKVTIIDGHVDMFREGFVPAKIFEVLAGGGYPIIQFNTGIETVFGKGNLPMYRNYDEFRELLYSALVDNNYLDIAEARSIALKRNYIAVAKELLEAYYE